MSLFEPLQTEDLVEEVDVTQKELRYFTVFQKYRNKKEYKLMLREIDKFGSKAKIIDMEFISKTQGMSYKDDQYKEIYQEYHEKWMELCNRINRIRKRNFVRMNSNFFQRKYSPDSFDTKKVTKKFVRNQKSFKLAIVIKNIFKWLKSKLT